MRRGHTLTELLVSMAVLATLGSITLRLTFAGDRALQTQTERATATSTALRLLHDVSDDLRASSSIRPGAIPTIDRTDGRVTYQPLAHGGGVRRTAGDVVEEYVGVQLNISGNGAVRTVTVAGKKQRLTTVVCLRRRG
jgi:prepilin-type N-terminal cleavage/methylation domain-containing protein